MSNEPHERNHDPHPVFTDTSSEDPGSSIEQLIPAKTDKRKERPDPAEADPLP